MAEVPEQDCAGLVGEVGVFGPAEVGLAGWREIRAGVDSERGRAGRMLLLQGVVAQATVGVPACRLLRAGCQSVEGEAETDEFHRVLEVLVSDETEGTNLTASGGPREEVTEQRLSYGLGGLGTGPGEANLGQEVLTLEVTQITAVSVAK